MYSLLKKRGFSISNGEGTSYRTVHLRVYLSRGGTFQSRSTAAQPWEGPLLGFSFFGDLTDCTMEFITIFHHHLEFRNKIFGSLFSSILFRKAKLWVEKE